MISIDGFFEGEHHDLTWHHVDEEFDKFSIKQLKSAGGLLLGRETYEMMASYWRSPQAMEEDPEVAKQMNKKQKYVVSHTLEKPDWKSTKLIKENVPAEIKKLKGQLGRDIFIFGSSDLAVSLLKENLIDEIRVMVNPVFLGSGKLLFQGILEKVPVELIKTKAFKSGNVLLSYAVKQ